MRFYRTYEGLKPCITFCNSTVNKRFYRTYEGLKQLCNCAFRNVIGSFYRTYEGLKLIHYRTWCGCNPVFIVPMRD